MFVNSRADILTIRSEDSLQQIERLIEKTIEGMKTVSGTGIRVKSAGTAMKLTGYSSSKPQRHFALEISVKGYGDHRDIDIAALGDDTEGGTKEAGSGHTDIAVSERVRRLFVSMFTEGQRDEIRQRIDYLQMKKLPQISKEAKEAKKAKQQTGGISGKEEYDKKREEVRKVCGEIKELRKKLREYELIIEEDKDHGIPSFFSLNLRYQGLSDMRISQITGIENNRIKEIREGAEPRMSELLAISEGFDVGIDTILYEWFRFRFGEYVSCDDRFTEVFLQEENLKALSFIVSSGLIVKGDEGPVYTQNGEITDKKPDEVLLEKIRVLLLKNNKPELALGITSPQSFYGVKKLSDLICSMETLGRYLFIKGEGSCYDHFKFFFNGLDNESDKKVLLVMMFENLNRYKDRCLLITEDTVKKNKALYWKEERNGMTVSSQPWIYCDTAQLETDDPYKNKVAELQDQLFNRRL